MIMGVLYIILLFIGMRFATIPLVYSCIIYGRNPGKEIVFLGIGFETTAPMTAQVIMNRPPGNFSVLCLHRLVPPAMFINPGHVSAIIGMSPYIPISGKYNILQVIAGFEPLDILMSIFMMRDDPERQAGCPQLPLRYVFHIRSDCPVILHELVDFRRQFCGNRKSELFCIFC